MTQKQKEQVRDYLERSGALEQYPENKIAIIKKTIEWITHPLMDKCMAVYPMIGGDKTVGINCDYTQ